MPPPMPTARTGGDSRPTVRSTVSSEPGSAESGAGRGKPSPSISRVTGDSGAAMAAWSSWKSAAAVRAPVMSTPSSTGTSQDACTSSSTASAVARVTSFDARIAAGGYWSSPRGVSVGRKRSPRPCQYGSSGRVGVTYTPLTCMLARSPRFPCTVRTSPGPTPASSASSSGTRTPESDAAPATISTASADPVL